MRLLLTVLGLALLPVAFMGTASGQSAADLEMDFGKPTLAYAVSEHLWMTPEFTESGQLCYARIYRRRISLDTNYLGNDLPLWELREVLDKLAPPETRGARSPIFGMSDLLGQMAVTSFGYERVSISFLTPLNFREDSGTEKSKRTKKTEVSKLKVGDMFTYPLVDSAEIVGISWNDRKCVGP